MEHKVVKDLGSVEGPLLLFGGVYSNLQALQALKQWADEAGYLPSNIFCTGDLLGYCAQPLECIKLAREWGIHLIAGNVELQLSSNEEDCGCEFVEGGTCDLLSKTWYPFTRARMTEDALNWLRSLPHHISFDYGGRKLLLVHGSWFGTADFLFASTPWSIKEPNFTASGSSVIIGGHCGLPFVDRNEDRIWLNAGVIGMPANDGDTHTWFVTAEAGGLQRTEFRFHRLEYDFRTACTLMMEQDLPPAYAKTLCTGIWDNCEILPAPETEAQGQPLAISLCIV